MTAPVPADPVAPPGPSSTDAALAAWRDAATRGGLPEPTRVRWQALRAGVLNLWEFDRAEYWFADGRAQFVGQNQSGKSTLMALTTLIMLAGDLDRQYVDTFGERHKTFRYYVEPTDDPSDRRESQNALNRGWAWVEYGRQTEGGPQYFTALLYAQARRGTKDFVKQWATCAGSARVGQTIRLAAGAQTAQPGDLADVPGFKPCSTGADYKQRLSSGLFGFDDVDRLDSAVKMLKVLRTPHLGRRLDPAFFTEQMREALPAIAKGEIDELAEGWDQLDKLAEDRDSAEAARDAVAAFLRRAWNPWADSILRRHADELVAANTRFDSVTRGVREAEEVLRQATAAQVELSSQLAATQTELERDEHNHEQLLKSQAYSDAQVATARVARLREDAQRLDEYARIVAGQAQTAAGREQTCAAAVAATESQRTAAEDHAAKALAVVASDGVSAGLPDNYRQWAGDHDFARLSQAVEDRKQHVRTAVRLMQAMDLATAEEDAAQALFTSTRSEHERRQAAARAAAAEREQALQALSDLLEGWADGLGADAPSTDRRTLWIDAVVEQTDADRPGQVLATLIRRQWLEPLTAPLREHAAKLEQESDALAKRADDLVADMAELVDQPESNPAPPLRWTRRARPDSGPHGAPLWLLLDPADGLPQADLDRVEAALDAAGLLDAWISPDGVYLPDRDGHDLALDLNTKRFETDPDARSATVGLALRPADNAGPLTAVLTSLLSRVGYCPAGAPLPAGPAVSADGRWTAGLTSGTAGPGSHGAELIGTAARTAARERRIALLRSEIAALGKHAAALAAEAAAARARVDAADAQAADAPSDSETIHAATDCRAAEAELARSTTRLSAVTAELEAAQTATASATSALLEHTAQQSLPSTDQALAQTDKALDKAARSSSDLRLAAQQLDTWRQHVEREQQAHEAARGHAVAVHAQARTARQKADAAADVADTAQEALGQTEAEILAAATDLKNNVIRLRGALIDLNGACARKTGDVSAAEGKLGRAAEDRLQTDAARARALQVWWKPVDAGLAAARGLPAAPVPAERLLTHALAQARAAREALRPAGWPDAADAVADKDDRVNAAYARMTGPALIDLRTVLEASGGRSAVVLDADETGLLPAVRVLVDSSGSHVEPIDAVARLAAQADQFASLHDEKMQQVLVELLSSTFVEHLRERLSSVVALLGQVNRILAAHPTGANRTTLQLKRRPAQGQQAAFEVLHALEAGFVDGEDVQAQVRAFLEQQIREAQEMGRAGEVDWKEHLGALLDYRRWFDVQTEYRVAGSAWKPLTAEVHAKDSGGGKVVTLLQPLLATLVSLYGESATAPRPLWLDEAFTGVDDSNRSTMLDLLVEFDLDFLLAGPSALVASAQVPAAAAWFVTRAPSPVPGVDLSLMLWAGNTMSPVPLPQHGAGPADTAEHTPDPARPSLFDEPSG